MDVLECLESKCLTSIKVNLVIQIRCETFALDKGLTLGKILNKFHNLSYLALEMWVPYLHEGNAIS